MKSLILWTVWFSSLIWWLSGNVSILELKAIIEKNNKGFTFFYAHKFRNMVLGPIFYFIMKLVLRGRYCLLIDQFHNVVSGPISYFLM